MQVEIGQQFTALRFVRISHTKRAVIQMNRLRTGAFAREKSRRRRVSIVRILFRVSIFFSFSFQGKEISVVVFVSRKGSL